MIAKNYVMKNSIFGQNLITWLDKLDFSWIQKAKKSMGVPL